MTKKEVLLVGFGAVGAVYALVLQRSGLADVTVVARSNFHAVNASGMTFKGSFGDVTRWRPARLVNSITAALDRQYSYVVLATKAIPDVIKNSALLSPLLSPPYSLKFKQPAYVVLQNGLNVESDLYEAVAQLGNGEPHIIGTALWIAASSLDKTVVQVENHHIARLHIGMYRGRDGKATTQASSEETQLLNEFASMMDAGGQRITIEQDIQRVKFRKNFWNAAFSSFATLTNNPSMSIFRPPPPDDTVKYSPYLAPTTAHLVEKYTLPAIHAVLSEVLDLGRALGYPDTDDGLPSSIVVDTIEKTRELHSVARSMHRPSMLVDAEHGRPLEVEAILGELVRMGQERDVNMPRVEMLYALLLMVQNQILRKMGEDARAAEYHD